MCRRGSRRHNERNGTSSRCDKLGNTIVPSGYTIAIHISSNNSVVGTNGAIAPPVSATIVNLVFRVTTYKLEAT
ncbi:hypothetical protein [Paenibacillus agricola]|uniref:DUF4183 domain-containing protein n=1 Tax=Paenibacillus agricola TaxID=2716264 RepID=A0ABX0JC47_9BACL|nr:hypothetical protein [Paenibacillus agricola]NHN34085.1 hypothetical protein [Paenibacillus agricola]